MLYPLVSCVLVFGSALQVLQAASDPARIPPISLSDFNDSINHALRGRQQVPYARLQPDDYRAIADNILAWQNADGGWPKNRDWLAVLTAEQRQHLPAGTRRTVDWQRAAGADVWAHMKPHQRRQATHYFRSLLDNRCTWPQIRFLYAVAARTGTAAYKQAAQRGLHWILQQQHASGGWRGADVDSITFNDDVMIGVMQLLRAVVQQQAPFTAVLSELPEADATALTKAYETGLRCILRCQYRRHGQLTAWGQDHDHKTFLPIKARSFELPGLTAAESVKVLRFLMTFDQPDPDIIKAVQAGVAWLDKVAIAGIRVEHIPAKKVKFTFHYCDFDRVVVQDPQAPWIWTRYYQLEDDRPFFANRDGRKVFSLAEVHRERRTGYAWYVSHPRSLLLETYPAWQQRWVPGESVLRRVKRSR